MLNRIVPDHASLHSRCLEVVGARKNGHARGEGASLPLMCAFFLVLTTSKSRLWLCKRFSRDKEIVLLSKVWTAHENSRHFTTPPLVLKKFPAKWHLRNECRNFILMTSHYPDLGSASDWLCCLTNLLQPIRRTTHIWVVKCHQYQILAVVS